MTRVPYAGDEKASLLGLVKHLAGGEYGWFCDTFGRSRESLPFGRGRLRTR
jgi:hypothetical protein